MKKLRGIRRRLEAFQRRLEEEVSSFPAEDRQGCGYWHLHMPCAQSFIDHSPNETRLRKQCIESILGAAEQLKSIKPEGVEARVVCSLAWPSLWDSQIIIFFGSDYYDRFFDRRSPAQEWTEKPAGWLLRTFDLNIPESMTERVYLERIRDEDFEYETTLVFVGELKP